MLHDELEHIILHVFPLFPDEPPEKDEVANLPDLLESQEHLQLLRHLHAQLFLVSAVQVCEVGERLTDLVLDLALFLGLVLHVVIEEKLDLGGESILHL